jgi:hypothetical protein
MFRHTRFACEISALTSIKTCQRPHRRSASTRLSSFLPLRWWLLSTSNMGNCKQCLMLQRSMWKLRGHNIYTADYIELQDVDCTSTHTLYMRTRGVTSTTIPVYSWELAFCPTFTRIYTQAFVYAVHVQIPTIVLSHARNPRALLGV